MSEHTPGPERIYLQVDPDGAKPVVWPEDVEGITWCRHSINSNDVEYVRADLIEYLYEALEALVTHVSAEPDGSMSGMANQKKRMQWYLDLAPIRENARAILAEIKGE